MSERGSTTKRFLDFWAGVPLAAVTGLLRRLARRSGPPPAGIQTIAVLCLGAIGDLLLASALLETLGAALPNARLTVIASRANAVALDSLHPRFQRAVFGVT